MPKAGFAKRKEVYKFTGQTILSFSLLEDKQNFKFGGV